LDILWGIVAGFWCFGGGFGCNLKMGSWCGGIREGERCDNDEFGGKSLTKVCGEGEREGERAKRA